MKKAKIGGGKQIRAAAKKKKKTERTPKSARSEMPKCAYTPVGYTAVLVNKSERERQKTHRRYLSSCVCEFLVSTEKAAMFLR